MYFYFFQCSHCIMLQFFQNLQSSHVYLWLSKVKFLMGCTKVVFAFAPFQGNFIWLLIKIILVYRVAEIISFVLESSNVVQPMRVTENHSLMNFNCTLQIILVNQIFLHILILRLMILIRNWLMISALPIIYLFFFFCFFFL